MKDALAQNLLTPVHTGRMMKTKVQAVAVLP